jgi:large subunit ribosomal protein L9
MAKIEVILVQNIVGLGGESDQVKVASGYARNYLIPQGLAIPLSAGNKRRLEALRQRRAEREAHELNAMTDLAKSLQKLLLVIKVRTGEDGKMFGHVTNGMIADELKHQFDISLDKRKIHLDQPVRGLGECEASLNLHADVKGTLKIRVESLNPIAAPAESPAEGKEAPKGERRGRRTEAGTTAEAGEKKPRGPKAKPAKAE